MGSKNGVWQQLSEETFWGETKQTVAGSWEGCSLYQIIIYVLKFDDKHFWMLLEGFFTLYLP